MKGVKNYTSTVPVDRTVARIEAALVRGGARAIAKDYDDAGALVGIQFQVVHPTLKHTITIRLPANAKAVFATLSGQMKKPRSSTMERLREQSERTAWRLVQDWVEVQIAMIELRQAEFLEVFLPYVWSGSVTFYGQLKSAGFAMLTAGGGRE